MYHPQVFQWYDLNRINRTPVEQLIAVTMTRRLISSTLSH
jgi:hypothetical protein